MGMQHGHTAGKCGKDMQQDNVAAARTGSRIMLLLVNVTAARTGSRDLQHEHAVCMYMQHEYAA
jgi:hypothetical protein